MDKAAEMTDRIIWKRQNIKIFWTASDLMARGVILGAFKNNKYPGKDFVLGGVDCPPEIQKLIEKGQITVSVGGHYTDGAWVILMVHDYLRGLDF